MADKKTITIAIMDAPYIILYLIVLTLLHPLFLAIVLVGGAILILIAVLNQRTTNARDRSGDGLGVLLDHQ